MQEIVRDSVAEKLEAAGLWRRAATRWLAVMDKPGISAAQLEWLRLRRTYCRRRLMVPQHKNNTETIRYFHNCRE